MTKSEVALVLTKAAAFDARTIGRADVEAWYELISELDFEETLELVTDHYRHNTERLMPVHLLEPDDEAGVEPWKRSDYDPGLPL
jgi:hypothetical protein